MGCTFHQLFSRYNGTLTASAPMAIRLWEIFTFKYFHSILKILSCLLPYYFPYLIHDHSYDTLYRRDKILRYILNKLQARSRQDLVEIT